MTDNLDLKGIKDRIDQVIEKAKADGDLYNHNPEDQENSVRDFLKNWVEMVFKWAAFQDDYVDEINKGVNQYLKDNSLVPESHERAVLKSVDPVPSKDGTLTFDIVFEKPPSVEIKIVEDDRFKPDLDLLEECQKRVYESMGVSEHLIPLDIDDPQMKPQGVITYQYSPVKFINIPIPEVVDYPLPNIPFKLNPLEGKE